MNKPPSGLVTFLFSDIEGSTQLWERKPELMQAAFARQEAIMRASMAAHDGYVYKMIGDAFQVAFADSCAAVTAAVAAQRSLHTEPWGEIGLIKVRMALHTGSTEERGDDYVGPLLNRVARLMSAGHGGQVLLSQATAGLVRAELPTGATLRDMGERRLKDLIQPEHVFQILVDGLPQDFPPLKSLDLRPNNLPIQLTRFVGREREMAEVRRALADARLLTLTGSGGAGKTRLSLQVAADVIDDFENGVWLVELAPLADPALVPQVVATILAVREEPGKTVLEALMGYVRDKQMLIILDNCEHLVGACAALAEALLRAAPDLHILVSSREALRIAGEVTYRVPSLQTPGAPNTKAPTSASALAGYESVQLFVDRAAAVQPGFVLTDANAAAVANICQRLDGIPLAIELAAARVRSLPPDRIAARLDDRFRLLTGGSRTALPRQQTLRAAIEWSYSLLSELPPSERALLRRLAVFAGAWSLEAAEAVCAWETETAGDELTEADVLDLVTSLVDKSLVVTMPVANNTRYHLLETIREFALEHLRTAGEEEKARTRHAAHFCDLVALCEPQLAGMDQKEGLDRLDQVYDDVRHAFNWQLTHDAAHALHLAGALGRFWDTRGYFAEGRETIERALRAASPRLPGAGDAHPQARAKAQRWQGLLALRQGDYDPAHEIIDAALAASEAGGDAPGVAEARIHLGDLARLQGEYAAARANIDRALAISRVGHDDAGEAYALTILGNVLYAQGDESLAQQAYQRALELSRATGDVIRVGKLLNNLGSLAGAQRDHAAARNYYEESLAIKRGFGDSLGIAHALIGLGEVVSAQGDIPAARQHFTESLSIAQELGLKSLVAYALLGLGNVERKEGNYAAARRCLRESLAIRSALGDKEGIATCLEDLGRLALAEGGAHPVQLLAAAASLRSAIGYGLTASEQADFEAVVAEAQAQANMTVAAFELAWSEGGRLTIEQAEVLAQGTGAPSPTLTV
jgi:predicted ATPase/class 3 adenylate cyclase/Tfp pilus assembly protein PilF